MTKIEKLCIYRLPQSHTKKLCIPVITVNRHHSIYKFAYWLNIYITNIDYITTKERDN